MTEPEQHEHCARCKRATAPIESNELLYWEASPDGAWICPGCITDEEQQAMDEDDMESFEEARAAMARVAAAEEAEAIEIITRATASSNVAPSLNPPRLGDFIARDGDLAYVKRVIAEWQAEQWNKALLDDPVFGPANGLRVGVGVKVDGRWPLVWVRA